ncbi:mediator of DNA damage checkpoint protein 1 [Tautogolabrus adspersus]
MDATQMISDSVLESEDEESEEENENKRGQPLAKLCILKNNHIPETELPLFLGDNVLGRDPSSCNLPLQASSVSKQHATICISAYRRKGCDREVDIEALVWDLGSMNGTRKGRLKLTPNVRYALSEQDCLVVADIPCKYVSCAVDEISSRGDATTSLSKNNGVTAKMPAVSGDMEIDANRSGKSFVTGGPKSRLSLPEDTRNTPVRHSCLSFEQTPTQPQASLVPQSDSDSDGERGEAGERRRKAMVSNTDSYKSSPTCSTFLSPTNKIVPESEDESPITPSSSSQNRPYRHVSFSKEETCVDVGRQQQKEKESLGVVDDSEEDGEGEERAALAGEKSEESRQHVQVKQDSDVSLTGEDELPVSTTTALTDEIPVFNMDSDTDMEGEEEEETSVGPVSLSTNQKADQQADTAQFHMDSDTDVEEDNDALDKVSKSVLPSADTKHPHVFSVIKPEGLTMDSDTDVDDDDAVSDAATKAKPVSFESTHTADCAPSTQPKDFHLDSDTDVDEEEEKECGTNTIGTKIDETPAELDIKPSKPESAPNAPHSVHVYSDTDDETAAVSEPSALSVVTESIATADKGADLGILSDSDTDVEDESLVIPVAVASFSLSPATKSGDPQLDSDADADRNECTAPPAGEGGNHVVLGLGSDANVEDKEGIFDNEGEDQIPSLCRENTPGLLVPLLHNCSTPLQMLEGQVEDMDTQAFLSPSTGPFRSAVAHDERLKTLPSLSDSNEDEDYVVAETQSFVLQTREGQGNTLRDPTQAFGLESAGDEKGEPSIGAASFQLGLSDSSHLQGQAQALAMESTQAFVSLEGGVTLEETQAYAANSNTERNSLENDANPEATQAYAEDEDARGSVMTEKEGHVDLDLEATQAYISEPYLDSEDETDMDEINSTASAETQPLDFPTSSTLAMAETQPMAAFEEEESLDEENLVSALEVNPKSLNETEERGENEVAAQPQELQLSKAMSVTDTQPMCTSDIEESDDEDSVISSRKRKSKQLQLEDEQTQTLTNSEFSAIETQPRGAAGNAESDEDSILGQRKRKAKRLHIQDEESQTLTNSELSAAETQPMGTAEDGGSDEEDSIPGPRKRRAKPLQIQEVESQPLTNPEASTVETQLLETNTGLQHPRGRGRQSDAGTSSIAVSGKRGTRTRLREEEDQVESSEPPRRQTRVKNVKALPTTRGRRGKSRPNESEEEEEVEQAKRTRGKKSMRQQQEDEKEEERLRLEVEKAETERIERERKVQEEKLRLESEKAEREKEKEKQFKEQEENKTEAPARSRRAARRTIAAVSTTQDSNDVPARRTRSRSNSSNSVSSERSASSVNAQVSRGRGRGRGAKRTSEPPPAASARSSNRRKTVAAGATQHDSGDVSPQGVLSRTNSTNSLNLEISSCSSASQSRGRGGRQRGRGRKLEADSVVDQSSALKPTGRGRKSRKGDESTNEIPDEDNKEKTDSQTSTTRGRRQASTNVSEPAAADEEGPSIQESATEEESPLLKRNVIGRVQKLVNKSVESPVGPALSDGDEAKRKGRKGELEENTAGPSSSCKTSKGKEKAHRTEAAAEEEAKVVTNDEIPVQAKRRGRASSAQAKRNAKGSPTEMEVTEEKMEEETLKRKGRGRQSAVQDKRKEQQDESGSSVDQDAHMEALEPQTPRSSVSRKRQAPADLSPVAKTPRSSSASPAAGGRSRSASQTYKVLFTGVVDEAGERVLARLGGSMAKGVADMNCLVTDKVRRTVKFLCAVAKGVPIVTTHWLEKSGKAGSFLSPHAFIVKDPEQEKKFSFCLQESLRIASSQPLLQGYEIHVTKSVKPEPVHMKDIISCSGATFLPKMPSSHKPQTLVISCEEDLSLCGPALAASLPVVTAEFILTGILQQKLDLQTHSISAPASNLPAAGGRGRGRRKT